jgi:DNA (cytosine-5)-methyltransferase 1
MSNLVLSLFPGIGLLDMAFEEEGFCVVRGPDLLWGGDIKRFHPPAGVFGGVIGGPPCQAHSSWAFLNRSRGIEPAEDLLPEFTRCVDEAAPEWWLMENVPRAPDIETKGHIVTSIQLDNRWLGEKQSRRRKFQLGTREGLKLHVQLAALEHPVYEHACLASEGRAGKMENRRRHGKQKTSYKPKRGWPQFCANQGLPADFLAGAPFTVEGKYRVVGNGVSLPMGRAVAKAVKQAIGRKPPPTKPRRKTWADYPRRTCYTLHDCALCDQHVLQGEEYHDGGHGRRAHVACVEAQGKETG